MIGFAESRTERVFTRENNYAIAMLCKGLYTTFLPQEMVKYDVHEFVVE